MDNTAFLLVHTILILKCLGLDCKPCKSLTLKVHIAVSFQVKDFEDLHREIISHLSNVEKARNQALNSEDFTVWRVSWPERPRDFHLKLWTGPRPNKTKQSVTPVIKAATASASVLVDTEPKVDESWLVGTNVKMNKTASLFFTAF